VLKAMADAGLDYFDGLYVGNMMSASANNQQHLGAYIADWVGQRGKDAYRLESACSSGAAAFRSALIAVASGDIDVAVAVGVEKMTDSPSTEITASLATAADADWEVSQGVSFVALNALIMQRYLHEYGWKRTDFANFSINAHANAMHNPFARFHMLLTEKQFEEAGVICDPITLLDASPIGDGAAAALLVPVDKLITTPERPMIRIAGSGAASDTIAAHSRKDPIWLTAAETSSRDAYKQAGIGPDDIDLFEYHDTFSIYAALALEAIGFAIRGKGWRLAAEGQIALNGRIPCATMGGLKARGFPGGATGVYQAVEAAQQLRGQAGANQVAEAHYALIQSLGGPASTAIAYVLERLN